MRNSNYEFNQKFENLMNSSDESEKIKNSRQFKKSDFNIYENKTITDYLCLDVEKNKISSHKSIKISTIDKIIYSLGRKNPLRLKKLQLKYLKPKEDILEDYVAKDQISHINNKITKIDENYHQLSNFNLEIANQLNHLTKNINIEEIINNNQAKNNSATHHHSSNTNPTISEAEKNFWNKSNSKKLIICYNGFDEILSTSINDNGYNHEINTFNLNNQNLFDQFDEMKYNFANRLNNFLGNIQTDLMQGLPFMAIESDIRSYNEILSLFNDKKFSSKINSDINKYIKYIEEESYIGIPQLIRAKIKDTTNLWNLKSIGAYEAQNRYNGDGINVAVIDTGVDYKHKEFSNNFDPNNLGYNFVDDDNNPFDLHNHGTHVAGTISGNTVGVAPNTNLFALKVLDENGSGTSYSVLKAIDWCTKNQIDIANLSLGGGAPSQAMQDICTYASKQGLNIVAAAGNDGRQIHSYPASYNNVISVAATDQDNKRAHFSNYNDMIDISGPGISIYSAIPNNKYDSYSGTSMATPHVSGTIALALNESKIMPNSLEQKMKDTATNLGEKIYFGAGLIKANKIIE